MQVSRRFRLVYDQSLLAEDEIVPGGGPGAGVTFRWCHTCQNSDQQKETKPTETSPEGCAKALEKGSGLP